MKKLRVGVVGCGSIAKHRHLPEYQNNRNVEIVALCDVVKERADQASELFGGQAYADYKEMIDKEDLDVVSVCTPNYLHAPVSIYALNAGINVLCEKPMATSKEEADEMNKAAEASGKKLMIAHNQRFVSSHQRAKKLIESGELGKIYSFRTAFGHPGPETWSADGKDSWFFKKEEAFIGAMGDLGVHKTDLLRYLLGEEIVEVGALIETSAKEHASVDDTAVCILKTESGMIGTLAASWSYQREDNSTIIYAEKAVLRLEDDPNHSLVVQYTNGETVKYELGKIQSNAEGGQSGSHVIDHFVSSILEDQDVLVDGNEGKNSLLVILAALESNETKKIINFKNDLN